MASGGGSIPVRESDNSESDGGEKVQQREMEAEDQPRVSGGGGSIERDIYISED